MNKKTVLILVLVLVVLIGGAVVLYQVLGAQVDAEQVGENENRSPAPDFTAYDIDGNPVRLSDFLGTPVVLNFWASWCGPCQSEMPAFEEAYKTYGDQVQFLLVNMTDGVQETLTKASTFVQNSGYTFPVLYDTSSSASITYSVYSLPTTYFIDDEGYAVAMGSGALDPTTLQTGIDMILE